jgi:hypothetical protein
MARWNVAFGMRRTAAERIGTLTLNTHKSLGLKKASGHLDDCVRDLVKRHCDFFAYANHLKPDGSLHRHLALSLKDAGSIVKLENELRALGRRYKIYDFKLETARSGDSWASYMTWQLRQCEFKGIGVRLVYFSVGYPKAITKRHARNDRRWRQMLRLVALNWHVVNEEGYWGLPAREKHRINYEVNMRMRMGEAR